MKIIREAYETAIAAGRESEVPLLLTGKKGTITDVLVIPACNSATYVAVRQRFILPMGEHLYGKVVTKNDWRLDTGCNLVEEEGRWKFVDDADREIAVEVI